MDNFSFEYIIALISFFVSLISLAVAIWSVKVSKKIAIADRKTNVYNDVIVFLNKINFIAQSSQFGFGEMLIKDVDDEWIKNQILIAVDIKSRIDVYNKENGTLFWEMVSEIFSKEHKFDYEKYNSLLKNIENELKN